MLIESNYAGEFREKIISDMIDELYEKLGFD